jgi:hypothetical protein
VADVTKESIRRTVLILKDIDPALGRAANKTMKKAAEPMVQEARSNIPEVPTGTSKSGRPYWGTWGGSSDRSWSASAAKRGIVSKVNVRKGRGAHDRVLLSMIQRNAAGAIFDYAGASGAYTVGARGSAFTGSRGLGLNGKPSRSMWRAAEAKLPMVMSGLDAAVGDMEKEINARLGAGLARLV